MNLQSAAWLSFVRAISIVSVGKIAVQAEHSVPRRVSMLFQPTVKRFSTARDAFNRVVQVVYCQKFKMSFFTASTFRPTVSFKRVFFKLSGKAYAVCAEAGHVALVMFFVAMVGFFKGFGAFAAQLFAFNRFAPTSTKSIFSKFLFSSICAIFAAFFATAGITVLLFKKVEIIDRLNLSTG